MDFFNDNAEDNYRAMQQHVRDLKFVFGPNNPNFLKAEETLAHVQQFIDNNPDCIIHWEGPLSIGISTPWIYCAAIWFRNKEYDGFACQPGEWSLHS
jgi:hypothetical protein